MPIDRNRIGYSLADTSKMTNVSIWALKVWERRYDFPGRRRSVPGRLFYTDDDVAAIRRIVVLAESGRSIGELIQEYVAGADGR